MRHRAPAWIAILFMASACQASSGGASAPTFERPVPKGSPSASAAPSIVPSATAANLPPAERFFTEGFDGEPAHWQSRQVENGPLAEAPQVLNGFLIFDLPAANQWSYEIYAPQTYADVRLDARVALRAGEQGSAGLICRYTETGGWYEFNIYSDRTYAILFGQWLSPGVARYTPLVREESEKIQPVENEIGLLCQGDILTPFINGAQIRRRQETTFGLTGGKVGISASAFENAPGTVAYDWVRISEP